VKLTKQELLKLSVSIMHIGLLLDLGGAAVFYLGGQLLRSEELASQSASESLTMLGYGLIAVSAAEIFTAVMLRKKWVHSDSPYFRTITKRAVFYRQFKLLFTVLFLITLTPAVYGFLYYILGGTETVFILLIVATMIGYMLIRVKPNDLEKSIGSLDLEDPD